MFQFIMGVIVGIFITMICIGIWAVFEDEKDDIRCGRNRNNDRR